MFTHFPQTKYKLIKCYVVSGKKNNLQSPSILEILLYSCLLLLEHLQRGQTNLKVHSKKKSFLKIEETKDPDFDRPENNSRSNEPVIRQLLLIQLTMKNVCI